MAERLRYQIPSDPLVLALEKDSKADRGNPQQCCSVCSINQRCTHSDKVYQTEAQEQELIDLFRPPPKKLDKKENSKGSLTSIPTPAPSRKKQAEPSPPSLTPKLYPPLPDSSSEISENEDFSPNGPIASWTNKQMKEYRHL